MEHSVYVLHSPRYDKYYVGQSSDPHRRLNYHNTIEKGFTARYRPWELVYKRRCKTASESRELERKIKSWKSKVRIRELVEGRIEL